MSDNDVQPLAQAIERVGMVLGALFAIQLGEVDQGTKAERLSRCGFSGAQIAALLGTTTNAVNVALHRTRKASKRKPKKRAKGGK